MLSLLPFLLPPVYCLSSDAFTTMFTILFYSVIPGFIFITHNNSVPCRAWHLLAQTHEPASIILLVQAMSERFSACGQTKGELARWGWISTRRFFEVIDRLQGRHGWLEGVGVNKRQITGTVVPILSERRGGSIFTFDVPQSTGRSERRESLLSLFDYLKGC